MKIVPLSYVMSSREECPDPIAIETGRIPIVAKIRFSDGKIELRDGTKTRTKMILAYPGDLIVSGINAGKGAIALYDRSRNAPQVAATIHYGAYCVREDIASPRYIWWLLRSHLFREIIKRDMPNGIKTELKPKRLLAIQVPLPPLPKQKDVAQHLDNAALLVSRARTLRNQADIETSVFLEATVQAAFAKFPESGVLGDIVTFRPRAGPSFPTNPQWDGIPVLMPSSVSGFGVNPNKHEFAASEDQVSSKDLLEEGDILIARGNKREQVGNAGIVPSECAGWVCANLIMRMKIDTDLVDPRFLIYWLRTPRMRAEIKVQMSGTNPNIQKINQKKILAFPFPTDVSLTEQDQLIRYFDSCQFTITRLQSCQKITSKQIDALLPSLLDAAFPYGNTQTLLEGSK